MDTDAQAGGRIFINGELLAAPVVRANGGGPKYHPRTFQEAAALLAPQVAEVRSGIARLDPHLRTRKVVVEAEVWANYLANSYFPTRLINQLKIAPLGSKLTNGTMSLVSSGDTPSTSKAYLLAVDEGDLERLLGVLRSSKLQQGLADEIRQFNGLRLSDARVRPSISLTNESGLQSFEAVLHPDPDVSTPRQRVPASAEVLQKFESLVISLGGRVHFEENDTVDGLTFVATELPPEGAEIVREFNPLRSLSPTPEIEINTGNPQPTEASIEVPAEIPRKESAPDILVFDGGVDATGNLFREHVTSVDLTGHGLGADRSAHGSAVTAAVLYGDIGAGLNSLEAAAKVTHYQIVPGPKEDASEYPWILHQIRKHVEASNAPIVNLSLGPKAVVEDAEPHRWTAVLDKIAHERGTLFVTAAGNNGHRDTATGLHRVQVPGDMVNGLCVGACDAPSDESSWNAAPYSARGPGRPGARVQPAVMAHGGTSARAFGRVRPNGAVHYDDWGTSYATPLITNTVAQFARELGDLSDAPTLRALVAHFAESTADHDVVNVGHGRLPASVAGMLRCQGNEATIIYQGLIARDEVLAFRIPLPTVSLSGMFDLRWTVAFTSPTDSAEAGEYTNAGLEATFRPHSQRHRFSRKNPATGRPQAVVRHLQRDSAKIAALLAEGWTTGPHPASRPTKRDHVNEQHRREQGKWETLWKVTDSLQYSSLQDPRIDISHVTREGGRITSDTEDIEFSLIVTVSSRKGLPIYADVQNQFTMLTPLPSVAAQVEAQTEVQL